MGSIMGAEGGRTPEQDESAGTWPEALPGDVYVIVPLIDCSLRIQELRSAAPVPPSLEFEAVDGLLALHNLSHTEAGVPKGACHPGRHSTIKV